MSCKLTIDLECEEERSTVVEGQQQEQPAEGRGQIGTKWKERFTQNLLVRLSGYRRAVKLTIDHKPDSMQRVSLSLNQEFLRCFIHFLYACLIGAAVSWPKDEATTSTST